MNYIQNTQNKSKAIWTLVKNYTGKHIIDRNSVLINFEDKHKDQKDILNDVNTFFCNQCPGLNARNENYALYNIQIEILTH